MHRCHSCILVVDDERAIRSIIADALTVEGFQVIQASNGAEALERAIGHRPRAIILDLMMPVLDGRAFLAAARDLPALAVTPVILLSAGRWVDAAAVGAALYLAKPFDLAELLDAVDELTGSARAA